MLHNLLLKQEQVIEQQLEKQILEMSCCCDHLKNACLTDHLMPLLASGRPDLCLMGEPCPNSPPPLFYLPPTPLFQTPTPDKQLRGGAGSQERGRHAPRAHSAWINKCKNKEQKNPCGRDRTRQQCTLCRKTNHVTSKCYTLHKFYPYPATEPCLVGWSHEFFDYCKCVDAYRLANEWENCDANNWYDDDPHCLDAHFWEL